MSIIYNYNDVKSNLESVGLFLDIDPCDYNGVTISELKCFDADGYKYNVVYDSAIRGVKQRAFSRSNPYTIENINHFIQMYNIEFECISNPDDYVDNRSILSFRCKRCGEIIHKGWRNVLRFDRYKNRECRLSCPNCDERLESIHALVLKQIFLHIHPDTILEERSCINPETNKVMPTDIVNHRLKIAVEIQSQWHDFPDIHKKDQYKKYYWEQKGYNFYNPDIRDFTILEMCQIFFDIDELPDYINYEYSNKLNLKKIQKLLDNHIPVPKIADELGVDKHRIYDAIGNKKLSYAPDFKHSRWQPLNCYDFEGNFLKRYETIRDAAKDIGTTGNRLNSCLRRGKMECCGYRWEYAPKYLN